MGRIRGIWAIFSANWWTKVVQWLEKFWLIKLVAVLAPFSLLIALSQFMRECADRQSGVQHQAWILIGLASGEKGDRGRTNAIQLLADTDASLNGLSVEGADLGDLTMTKVDVGGADFSHTQFGDLVFRDCNLADANFSGAEGASISFIDCSLEGIDLSRMQVGELIIRGHSLDDKSNASGANWDYLDAREAKIVNILFLRGTAIGAVFDQCLLSGMIAREVDFSESSFVGTEIKDCEFRGANFSFTKIREAKIIDSSFPDVDWLGVSGWLEAIFQNVSILNSKNLTEEMLEYAD